MHGECVETGKVRYATARAAHAVICKARWGKRIKVQPRRAYYCKSCQGYHLTSKTNVWQRRNRLSRKVISARAATSGEADDILQANSLEYQQEIDAANDQTRKSDSSKRKQARKRKAK